MTEEYQEAERALMERAVPIDEADPLIAALEIRHPIDAAVLKCAVDYRVSLVDQLQREIEILEVTRARMLNEPAM